MSDATFYLEFLSLGGQVKVMAIDPVTGIEVSIIAPESASQSEMSAVAVEKLKRRIEKETSASSQRVQEDNKGGLKSSLKKERGILV